MSDLKYIEKNRLERLFDMGGGYVLNFTNRTFREFIIDSVSVDIYGGKYNHLSCSKANLLRKFWEVEPNHIVGSLLADLVEYARDVSSRSDDKDLISNCNAITERMRIGAPIEELSNMTEEISEKSFEVLIKTIKSSIDNNEPETALDRLHTFVIKYFRQICVNRGIDVSKEKPIHSLLGEYIKKLRNTNVLESQMSERILKSSISVFEAFNTVRNDHSLAHDNITLNYEESLLIFNNVVSTIRFIQSIERRQIDNPKIEDKKDIDFDDLPF